MALKGESIIELTNVKTGEKEVYHDTNLVTNAISDFIAYKDSCILNGGTSIDKFVSSSGVYAEDCCLYNTPSTSTTSFSMIDITKLKEIYENRNNCLIGGILLYQNALEEDATKYYADDTNPIIGYANGRNHGTGDPKRGMRNLTESQALDDGYKFVYDFSTSEANGKISAIALTTTLAGARGYGSTYAESQVGFSTRYLENSFVYEFKQKKNDTSWTHISTYEYDFVNSLAWFVGQIDDRIYFFANPEPTKFECWSMLLPINSISIIDSVRNNELNPYNEASIRHEFIFETTTIESSIKNYMEANPSYSGEYYTSSKYHGITSIDLEDGNVMLLATSNDEPSGTSTAPTTINWAKINLTSGELTEGQWTIEADLACPGNHYTWVISKNNGYYTGKLRYDLKYAYNNISYVNVCYKDGYLYWIKYDRKGVYKINLSNITDVTLIACDFEIGSYSSSSSYSSSYYSSASSFSNILVSKGGIIYGWNFYIINNKIYEKSYTHINNKYYAVRCYSNYNDIATNYISRSLEMLRTRILTNGPYWILLHSYSASASSSSSSSFSTVIDPTWLATINNLSTPVVKTADKTMKITYTIREVADES